VKYKNTFAWISNPTIKQLQRDYATVQTVSKGSMGNFVCTRLLAYGFFSGIREKEGKKTFL